MKFLWLIAVLAVSAFADVTTTGQADSLLQSFSTASASWRAAILPAAMYVFYALVLIDWVIEFGFMAIKGTDIGEIFAVLIRKSLVIGFFLMLFSHSSWLASIPNSLSQLGNTAASVPVDPDKILDYAINIVNDMWEGISLFEPGDSLALIFTGIVMLIAFGLMSAQLFMTYVKMYALLAVAPLIFSLAGLQNTRQMAYNPFFAIIKVGLELLFLKLFMGLTITKMHEFAMNVNTDNGSIIVMLLVSILMASVVMMVPGMVEAIANGSLGANSTSGMGTAQAVAGGAMGAARGAVGMGAAVKAASNLAKEQRAAGDSTASTMKNLRSAFGADVKRSFAGENYGGSMGGRMAFKHSNAESLDTQFKAQKAVNSGDTPQGTSDGFKRSNDDAGALAGKK